jgi:hypothetical protein
VKLLTIFAGLAMLASAQQREGLRPNFSGTWKLNLAESTFPGATPTGVTRVIEQADDRLDCTHEREIDGKNNRMHFNVVIAGDGEKMDADAQIFAQWKGDALLVILKFENGMRQTQSWRLSQDRKKFVDTTRVRQADGTEATTTRVFDKQ